MLSNNCVGKVGGLDSGLADHWQALQSLSQFPSVRGSCLPWCMHPMFFSFFLLVFRYCLSTVHTARWSSPRQLAAWLMNKLTPDTPPFFRSLSCPETISSNHYLILKYFVGERSSLFRVDIKLALLSISLIPIGGNSSKMPMVIDFLLTTAPNQLASGLRSRTIDTARLKILP